MRFQICVFFQKPSINRQVNAWWNLTLPHLSKRCAGPQTGESRLGLPRHIGIENHQNLTTNAAREPENSPSIRPLNAQISKRDSPGPHDGRKGHDNWQREFSMWRSSWQPFHNSFSEQSERDNEPSGSATWNSLNVIWHRPKYYQAGRALLQQSWHKIVSFDSAPDLVPT